MNVPPYILRRSRRVRHIRLGVLPDGTVTVTMPYGIREEVAQRFVSQKEVWIREKKAYFAQHQTEPYIRHTPQEYRRVKEEARRVITEAVERYARGFGFRYRAIAIRNQSTRWGSCSKQGNVNFSYRLLFVPTEVREYVVVHELCHLQEMNHSKKFWSLVGHILPDYRARRILLHRYRLR